MVKKVDNYLFKQAKRYIPGGVNSPARSFKGVGGVPLFIDKAKGSKIYDASGNKYIDYCLSWGALILGHSYPKVIAELKKALEKGSTFGAVTKLETELAKLIVDAVPSVEQVRLTNSGTEAVMGAIRLARAYTKKNKIIKFEGSYHGHADYLLNSPGVPKDFTKHTLIVKYNNIEAVKKVVKKYHKDLAAIIVEPVAGNYGVILPKAGFLQELRKIANKYNIVLIFDEVITGFRVSYSGAQGYFKLKPDLTCLGKIVGGGLPLGAFGGRKEIMNLLAPVGKVYQAGTLSGNPLAVTAGITTLKLLKNNNLYKILEEKTKRLCERIEVLAKEYKIGLKVYYIASMFNINTNLFKEFFHSLLKEGIYLSPSVSEANFLSTQHTVDDINKTLDAVDNSFRKLKEGK